MGANARFWANLHEKSEFHAGFKWDDLYVRILDPNNGLLLREHVRQKRGWYRIKEQDHPKHRPLRVSQLLWRASRAGTSIGSKTGSRGR